MIAYALLLSIPVSFYIRMFFTLWANTQILQFEVHCKTIAIAIEIQKHHTLVHVVYFRCMKSLFIIRLFCLNDISSLRLILYDGSLFTIIYIHIYTHMKYVCVCVFFVRLSFRSYDCKQ